jgi:hypothetical protein
MWLQTRLPEPSSAGAQGRLPAEALGAGQINASGWVHSYRVGAMTYGQLVQEEQAEAAVRQISARRGLDRALAEGIRRSCCRCGIMAGIDLSA